jgi:heme o synthase
MVRINEILTLIKYKIAFFISFTALAGYLLFNENIDHGLFVAVIAVFFLSSGAMALNQLQERKYDALMNRTQNRPLVQKKISVKKTICIIIVLFTLGSTLLVINFHPITLFLGLFNIFWYNLVYTPLKRITPFAVIPGSVIGAIPALLGWCAAGGNLLDVKIWGLAMFLFLWQIPHFWLILYYYNDDYELGGFPGIKRVFNPESIKYIIFIWVLTMSVSSMLFPIFKLITNPLLVSALILTNLSLIAIFLWTISKKKPFIKSITIASLNLYMFLVLVFSLLNNLL